MTFPALDGMGLLPVTPIARHAATTGEVKALFVDGATSHLKLRHEMWVAYLLWAARAARHFGHGEAWLSGTFITALPRDPELRVAFFPRTPSMAGDAVRRGDVGLGLLTVEDMFYLAPNSGGSVSHMRSVGGIMDSYVGSMKQSDGWDAMWSLLGASPTGQPMSAGYVSLQV